MTAKQMALGLATAIGEKKGAEVRVLDLRGVCGFADYFVLATGTSARHVRALADSTRFRVTTRALPLPLRRDVRSLQ